MPDTGRTPRPTPSPGPARVPTARPGPGAGRGRGPGAGWGRGAGPLPAGVPAAAPAASGPAPPGVPDEDAAPFRAYAARGELRIQRCSGCGASRFPPGPCCPSCQSFRSHWRRTSGRGRIWSYVVAHPPPVTGDAAPGPRHLVLVELPDTPGVRLAGDLVTAAGAAPDPAGPAGLCVGAPVRVVFRVTAGGVTVPCWLLEPPGGGGPGSGRPRGRPERSPLPGRAGRDVS